MMSRPGWPPNHVTSRTAAQTPELGEHLQTRPGLRSGAQPEASTRQSGRWARSSPYLEGQQPGDRISEAQICSRLQILRPHARWIRSFSCTDGHEQMPRIAHELGLKTLVGAWLGTDAAFDENWKGSPDPLEPEQHWGLFTADRQPKLVMQALYPDLLPQAANT